MNTKTEKLSHIKGREIIDSRGFPTLEVEVWLENGKWTRASVPSGASTGQFEALELRDGNSNYFFGKGLNKALRQLSFLSSKLKNFPTGQQEALDEKLIELDGTHLKTNLGANTVLGVSLAYWKLNHLENSPYEKLMEKIRLPVPLMNIINGGVHGSNNLNIQEFMIVPFGFETFKDSLRAGCEIFQQLKTLLKSKNLSLAVGDEGGFTPELASHKEALDLIMESIEKSGYKNKVGLALDCASSEFYKEMLYHMKGQKKTAQELISLYKEWVKNYPILSIEDGLAEEDWEGWRHLTEELGKQIQLVGDDLFVTQSNRLERGIKEKTANSLLVKCNQVGTVSEALRAVKKAQQAGYTCVMSHRSGETEDTVISDLAVHWNCEQIKTGSLCRGERTAKYNQLLRIEEQLDKPVFFGKEAFKQNLQIT